MEAACIRIPGHKLILAAYSAVFKSKLSRWAEDNELQLLLPYGQLEVGELLIRCMYQPQPQLGGCSQQRLMQLLQLADKHDVSRAVYAASSALSSTPAAQLEWDTVAAVYSLPPGCPELDAFRPLYKAVAAKVQQELGDLEQVWSSEQLSNELLALPHLALLTLLQDPATHVASEHTVPYTIQRWAAGQQVPPSQEQLVQLVQQIRMWQCSNLYVTTVMHALPAIGPCLTQQEWLLASALAGRTRGNPYCSDCFCAGAFEGPECDNCGADASSSERHLVAERHPDMAKFPAWKLGRRPASAVTRPAIDWQLPVREVVSCVDAMMGPQQQWTKRVSTTCTWAGRSFYLMLFTMRGGSVSLGIALGAGPADKVRPAAVCEFSVRATVAAAAGAPGDWGADQPSSVVIEERCTFGGGAPVLQDCFRIGSVGSGLEAERRLRGKGLVHGDGSLHLRLEMSEPVM